MRAFSITAPAPAPTRESSRFAPSDEDRDLLRVFDSLTTEEEKRQLADGNKRSSSSLDPSLSIERRILAADGEAEEPSDGLSRVIRDQRGLESIPSKDEKASMRALGGVETRVAMFRQPFLDARQETAVSFRLIQF